MWLGQDVENGYLLFAKDWKIKRISYAASFGTSVWEYTDEQTQICKLLLKNLMQYLLENQMVWSYVKSILI